MRYFLIIAFVLAMLSSSFGQATIKKQIMVKNTLPFGRKEIVSIPISRLSPLSAQGKIEQLVVTKKNKVLISQWVDNNSDSIYDELIFQADLKANEEVVFQIEKSDSLQTFSPELKTYSRLVPERIDDYAWENDLVAFRTYGPEAQRLVDAKEKGGTLSSGLDCWLKRVNYPVIDKWYKKYVDGGSYHKDDGEGYDPYHVGASRGCGGVGVWKNDSLYVSKNFISAKKIADGPLRNIFELTYATWYVDGISVEETKRITIDMGSQLYQVEVVLKASSTLPNCTIGLTLHDKKGATSAAPKKGYFSYWEAIDDSEIGTGVVVDTKYVLGYKDFRTNKKDLSQLYIITKPRQNKVVYHTGFGWKKANLITSKEEWNNYLDQFSQRLISPLQVKYN
jgi:Domain of unknown function (DUF4861)